MKSESVASSRSNKLLTWGMVLLMVLALPGAASAYWACVSYEGPHGSCWEWCDEYYDHNDEPTGRWKIAVQSSC